MNRFTSISFFQTEIAKRLNGILAQILPFLSNEVRALSPHPTHSPSFPQFWCSSSSNHCCISPPLCDVWFSRTAHATAAPTIDTRRPLNNFLHLLDKWSRGKTGPPLPLAMLAASLSESGDRSACASHDDVTWCDLLKQDELDFRQINEIWRLYGEA